MSTTNDFFNLEKQIPFTMYRLVGTSNMDKVTHFNDDAPKFIVGNDIIELLSGVVKSYITDIINVPNNISNYSDGSLNETVGTGILSAMAKLTSLSIDVMNDKNNPVIIRNLTTDNIPLPNAMNAPTIPTFRFSISAAPLSSYSESTLKTLEPFERSWTKYRMQYKAQLIISFSNHDIILQFESATKNFTLTYIVPRGMSIYKLGFDINENAKFYLVKDVRVSVNECSLPGPEIHFNEPWLQERRRSFPRFVLFK